MKRTKKETMKILNHLSLHLQQTQMGKLWQSLYIWAIIWFLKKQQAKDMK